LIVITIIAQSARLCLTDRLDCSLAESYNVFEYDEREKLRHILQCCSDTATPPILG